MNFAHLVCVTNNNNNKFYDMSQINDRAFEVTYGRVGGHSTKKMYSMSQWNTLYNQKTRKGYEDVTHLVATKTVEVKDRYKPIPDAEVAALIDYLRAQAKDTIQRNYTVAALQVTSAMISSAQAIINRLASAAFDVTHFNDLLLELFTIIPRRMGKVADYLANTAADYPGIIKREQELLDIMAGQVSDSTTEVEYDGDSNITLLEANGLVFSPVTDKDITIIKKSLGAECAHLFYKAWKVENVKTERAYRAFLKGKGRIAKKLYWHGSRTENWWSILRTGLSLRPTNAVINGKMFGNGIYFAPRAKKSTGYTSLKNAVWTKGTSNYGFMALHEVAYGKPHNVDSACFGMNLKRLEKVAPGCHCVHAHAGKQLYNDEIIIYREDQTTIKYLVELKAR